MVAGGKLSFVLSATTLAQQNLGNLEQFVNQPVAYEDAGLNLFGDGSGDYSFETYNDATLFDNELFDDSFEDADADLFMSSTISLTTTTPAPSTTSTTTTTTTTTAPTRDPERMDSRLRGRPERPRFVPTEQSAVEDAGLFDYYGDAMFGFDNYDGTDYQTEVETSTTNNRPLADQQVVNQQRSGGTGGYCRVCHGQDPTTCRSQPAEQCTGSQDACIVRITGTTLTGFKIYSQCSTENVCRNAAAQNFVGPIIYNQCRSTQTQSRFLRNNSVCSTCYKQADASNSDDLLFAKQDGKVSTTTSTEVDLITDIMANPTTYLDESSNTFLFATQDWTY